MSDDTVEVRARKLLDELLVDPKIGGDVRAKAKELFSDVSFPEDRMAPVVDRLAQESKARADALEAELKAIREERAAEKEAATARAQEISLENAVKSARERFNLTDEGMNKMLDHMKATGNYTDAMGAAAYIASQTPPAKVSGPSWAPQALNLFGSNRVDEALADLHNDPIGYQDKVLSQFVADPDGFVAETFGRA